MFPDLKTHITARLRSIYFPADETGEWKGEPLTRQSVDDLASMYERYFRLTKPTEVFFTIETLVAYRHWSSHTQDAIMATMNDPIWGGNCEAVCQLLIDMTIWMGEAHNCHMLEWKHMQSVNAAVAQGHYEWKG